MLGKIINGVEQIERLAKHSSDASQAKNAIQSVRDLIRSSDRDLKQLDSELSTWQSKLEVIYREPVGRQGMAKHAAHWAEKLRKINV